MLVSLYSQAVARRGVSAFVRRSARCTRGGARAEGSGRARACGCAAPCPDDIVLVFKKNIGTEKLYNTFLLQLYTT